MIPESFVQEVLARVDIVDLIERHVPLKKGGANYAACCPFHNEKSPSFTVSPSKQFYHCFGCGAHGTAIGFLMEYAGLSFPDAIKELAQQVGLTVPEEDRPDPQKQAQSQSLLEIMARAAKFYRDELKKSHKAINYLKGRGLTGEIAARYGIGYAPEGWQGLRAVFGGQYENAALVEAGLVITNDTGRRYDRFRDRVMFPICDQRGNIIGFGGRVLGPDTPKYLNSPETPLFEKGRELYGLHQARQAIRESNTVVVTEGYMDVVALAQFGFGAAVATLGTATTATHIQKLFRQAERVVFCFDGDKAGRKAARRALENSLEHLADDRAVRFLFLPAEHDPDSYIREQGLVAFQRALDNAMPLSDFMLRELRGELNLDTAEGRARLVHEAKDWIPRMSAPILRSQTLRLLAEHAGMDTAEVERALGLEPGKKPRPTPRRLERQRVITPARQLLRLLCARPALCAEVPAQAGSLLEDESERDALQLICERMVQGVSLNALFESQSDAGLRNLLADLLTASDEELVSDEEAGEFLADTLRTLQRNAVEREIAAITQRASNVALSSEEIQRYTSLLQQKQQLKTGQKPSV
ncbi:DNA primase [Uliginosibacterium sediminicola]|uniref:DNA primase n=1 Tax=Uliginosibacterium sediminicola TaxID=2024550 RepID=A0ABU9YWJ4_9RHOO